MRFEFDGVKRNFALRNPLTSWKTDRNISLLHACRTTIAPQVSEIITDEESIFLCKSFASPPRSARHPSLPGPRRYCEIRADWILGNLVLPM